MFKANDEWLCQDVEVGLMVVEAACFAGVSHKDGVPVRPTVVEPHREAWALQVTSYGSPPGWTSWTCSPAQTWRGEDNDYNKSHF
jgi:hypothetical protein